MSRPDYRQPHVLLPFLEQFIASGRDDGPARVEMVGDGSLRVQLGGHVLIWSERSRGAVVEVRAHEGIVSEIEPGDRRRGPAACRHVARRLSRLLEGDPPHLLQWRNRNLERIYWGTRLFNRLGPGLLEKGYSRYFDYTLSGLDEYEGFVNLEWRSRSATVGVRLALRDTTDANPVCSWGDVDLVVGVDERNAEQRRSREHRVEDYVAYLLSRNLPPSFVLVFDRGDPPAAYLPPDFGIDLLQTADPDDSSFFDMLLASPDTIAVVSGCDRECLNQFSLVASSRESRTLSAPWQSRPSPGFLGHCFNVGLTTAATVMGGDSVADCLQALPKGDTAPELVVLFDSCLHHLIGADMGSRLDEYRRCCDAPLIFYDIRTSRSSLEQVSDFWTNLVAEVGAGSARTRPGHVTFLGVDAEPADEVGSLLGEIGIQGTSWLFPELRLQSVRGLGSTSLVVVNSWEYVTTVFEELLADLGKPVLRLALPYGVNGTLRWLESIAGALKIEGAWDIDPARERFFRARRRLVDRRIAVVGRCRDIAAELTPARRFGIPLVRLFHELGLGVHLLLYRGPGEAVPDAETLGTLGLSPDRDSTGTFDHRDQLEDALHDGDFELVYTETYRDRRVTAAGKVPVHPSTLRPGLQGVVRTARTLGAMLEASFYPRYRSHLRVQNARMGSGCAQ